MPARLKHTLIFSIIVFFILNPINNFRNLSYFDLSIFLYLLILYLLIFFEKPISAILSLPLIVFYLIGIFLLPINFPIYLLIIILITTLLFSVSLSSIIKIFDLNNQYSYRDYISFVYEERIKNANRKKRLPAEANAGIAVGSFAIQKALHFTLPGLGFIVKPIITSLFGIMDQPYYDNRLNVEVKNFVQIISEYESLLFRICVILFLLIPSSLILITYFFNFSYIEPYLVNSQLKKVLILLWNNI